MTDHYDAVTLILERLKTEGLSWYRSATRGDVDLFERRVSGNFSVFDSGELHQIGRKPVGSLPSKKILIMPPLGREKESVLGMWLRWDFDADPYEFRLFLGHWSEIEGEKSFIAFRFEAPEQGEEHDFYHCQPCRNFGDKVKVPHAVPVSEHFPTVPINASNIVELTACAIMAVFGRKETRRFFQKMMRDSGFSTNNALRTAYARCCKEVSVDFSRFAPLKEEVAEAK
ncbi:hypothetical protein ELH75_34980 [Rhizobium leguminosarum]|uniref:hypothetical protein n=1 Tax=Rhizobium leguminosarum TaxID=384 RepID=UPI001030754F|nr:hypothetical protein [Rhizobium leguminosarum]TAZ45339.1 hypothetical protein ELH75_34980 [Rhizobium leguminosarum]